MLISSAQIGTPGLAWLVRLGREREKILCERIRFCSDSDTRKIGGKNTGMNWHTDIKVRFRKKNVFFPNVRVFLIMLSLHNNYEKNIIMIIVLCKKIVTLLIIFLKRSFL